MQRSQDRTKIADLVQALLHPLLVAIEARQVETVRTTYVQAPVAVDVAQSRALRFGHYRAKAEFLAHRAREWEGNPVGVGETQIGETLADFVSPSDRFR